MKIQKCDRRECQFFKASDPDDAFDSELAYIEVRKSMLEGPRIQKEKVSLNQHLRVEGDLSERTRITGTISLSVSQLEDALNTS